MLLALRRLFNVVSSEHICKRAHKSRTFECYISFTFTFKSFLGALAVTVANVGSVNSTLVFKAVRGLVSSGVLRLWLGSNQLWRALTSFDCVSMKMKALVLQPLSSLLVGKSADVHF